jgi:hypothetical protein
LFLLCQGFVFKNNDLGDPISYIFAVLILIIVVSTLVISLVKLSQGFLRNDKILEVSEKAVEHVSDVTKYQLFIIHSWQTVEARDYLHFRVEELSRNLSFEMTTEVHDVIDQMRAAVEDFEAFRRRGSQISGAKSNLDAITFNELAQTNGLTAVSTDDGERVGKNELLRVSRATSRTSVIPPSVHNVSTFSPPPDY